MKKKIFRSRILYYFSIIVNVIVLLFLAINFKEEYEYAFRNRSFKNVEFFYLFAVLGVLLVNILSLISLTFKGEKSIIIIRINLIIIIGFFLFKLSEVNLFISQNPEVERSDFILYLSFVLFFAGYFYFVEKLKYIKPYNEIEQIGQNEE